jgi:large subunit ribosomal protein L18
MKKSATTRAARIRRHARVRRRVQGSADKPRLCVYRSLSHIYAQVIDDVAGATLVSASDVEKDIASKTDGKKKADVATLVGTLVAERAKQRGISQVVFDRGGYPFHGRIKALAEAARAGGLEF